jgi:hypothetical protein
MNLRRIANPVDPKAHHQAAFTIAIAMAQSTGAGL